MSDETNGMNEGNALPPEPRAESNLSATELEIQHNKARAAVDYFDREIEAAKTAAENAAAKAERLQEQADAALEAVETAKAEVEAAEGRKTDAELHLAGFEGENN